MFTLQNHSSAKYNSKGFSLVEVLVVLGIVAALGTMLFMSARGNQSSDNIDRALQGIHDDLVQMRSRSISANTDIRINFLSNSTWRLETESTTPGTWVADTDTRTMPSNTYLTAATFASAGSNLVATPRGIFELNGAPNEPFVTVEALGTSKTRSINVAIGGAIEKTR